MTLNKNIFVFDANFFICMISINARDIISNLKKVISELDYDFYISNVVFDEIKVGGSYKDNLKQIIEIRKVDTKRINQVKKELDRKNIRFPAQDNDLSLVGLSKDLISEFNLQEIHLVTDDFKLAKNTSLLYPRRINILSLSSFLLKIHRSASKSQMRNYFKKQILLYNESYIFNYIIDCIQKSNKCTTIFIYGKT